MLNAKEYVNELSQNIQSSQEYNDNNFEVSSNIRNFIAQGHSSGGGSNYNLSSQIE